MSEKEKNLWFSSAIGLLLANSVMMSIALIQKDLDLSEVRVFGVVGALYLMALAFRAAYLAGKKRR